MADLLGAVGRRYEVTEIQTAIRGVHEVEFNIAVNPLQAILELKIVVALGGIDGDRIPRRAEHEAQHVQRLCDIDLRLRQRSDLSFVDVVGTAVATEPAASESERANVSKAPTARALHAARRRPIPSHGETTCLIVS